MTSSVFRRRAIKLTFFSNSLTLTTALAMFAAMPRIGVAGGIQIVVKQGDTDPARSGFDFADFGLPSINNANQIAYVGGASTGDDDIFRSALGSSTPAVIATHGGPAPGGGSFSEFHVNGVPPPALNSSGQVAFSPPNGPDGIFRENGLLADGVSLVLGGQAAPGGNGTFIDLQPPTGFNNLGQAGFTAAITGTTGGATDNEGVFRANGTSIVELARAGETTPNGIGTFAGGSGFGPVSLNFSGRGAFVAAVTGTSNSNDRGVFTSDGVTRTQVARFGDLAPVGGGTFTGFFTDPVINDVNQVAFGAALSDKDSRGAADAIYRNTAGVNTEIAYAGEPSPGGVVIGSESDIDSFGDALIVNNAGQVCTLIGSHSSPNTGAGGIIRGDGTTLTLVAHIGESTPRGGATVMSFFGGSSFAMNQSGDVAFTADLTNSSDNTSSEGLFLYSDALGLFEIAQLGDPLDGSTITELAFAGATAGADAPPTTGLSDSDQVAFRYDLANGSEGIAVWSVPEPTSLCLFALGGILSMRRRRA